MSGKLQTKQQCNPTIKQFKPAMHFLAKAEAYIVDWNIMKLRMISPVLIWNGDQE